MATATTPNVAATARKPKKPSDFVLVETRKVYLHKGLAATQRPDLSAGMEAYATGASLKVRNLHRSRNGGSGTASTYIAPLDYTFPSERPSPTNVRLTNAQLSARLRALASAQGMTPDELVASLLPPEA